MNRTEPTARDPRARLTGAVLLIGLVACGGPGESSPRVEDAAEPRLVPATRFSALDGTSVSLSDLRGSVLVVNFWGTWCVPCRREIPELVELHEMFDGRGVEVVGIAVDSGEPEAIREFMDGFGVRYRLWMTGAATAMAEFGSVGYPFTLMVDRDGRVVSTFTGPQTVESMAGTIERLLAAPPGQPVLEDPASP